MDQQTSKLIDKMVSLSFTHLARPARKGLAELIMAFFHNRWFTLWEIASCLSAETTTKHKHKRLIYFLDRLILDAAFWRCVILTVFSLPGFRFKSRKYIILALDATTLKDDFWMLAVSVSYQGRSIPIYLRSWEGVNISYDFWERVREVLIALKDLLPARYQFELVADRGFQGQPMRKLLTEIGWDYVVRVNGHYRMKEANGQEWIQLDLFGDGLHEQLALGKTSPMGPLSVAISSIETSNGTARWYLMSNLADYQRVVDSYRQRFWIEESFKDLKSKLRWETYTKKIPEADRLPKGIAVSCLSYAIQTSIGSQITLSKSEQRKTSVFNRFRQAYQRTNKNLQNIITKFIRIISTYFRCTKVAFS